MSDACIAFGHSAVDVRDSTDDEFLKAIAWDRSAPSSLRDAAGQGDVLAFCREWHTWLASRISQKKMGKTRAAASVLWSESSFEGGARTALLGEALRALCASVSHRQDSKRGRRPKGKAGGPSSVLDRLESATESWLAAAESEEMLEPFALLAQIQILSAFSSPLSADTFWRLWRLTLLAGVDLSIQPGDSSSLEMTPDQKLILEGELPWQYGLLFAGVKGASAFRRCGQKCLRSSLINRTDTDGMPDAELLARLPLWLAPLVRSAESAGLFDVALWDDKGKERWESLVMSVTPLCRPDGRIALTNGSSSEVVSLLRMAAKLSGYGKADPPRRYLLGLAEHTAKPRKPRKPARGERSEFLTDQDCPARQSDWAQLACLRSDWSVGANCLVVAHDGNKPLIDLTARGKSLLSGVWDLQVTVASEQVDIHADWECVCWHSDEDADFLELQAQFDGGLLVQRQLLLSRKDDFALLADSLSEACDGPIEYLARLPLAEGIRTESMFETRECVLSDGDPVARLFPLALPQQRTSTTSGGFGPSQETILLKQVTSGRRLYAPIIIDWSPARRRVPGEWRTLTVTEARKVVSPESAIGHRLRLGRHHLLVYHGAGNAQGPRAVLGQHTPHETVVGVLGSSGDFSPIVLVE